jgi:hypothetical protein
MAVYFEMSIHSMCGLPLYHRIYPLEITIFWNKIKKGEDNNIPEIEIACKINYFKIFLS